MAGAAAWAAPGTARGRWCPDEPHRRRRAHPRHLAALSAVDVAAVGIESEPPTAAGGRGRPHPAGLVREGYCDGMGSGANRGISLPRGAVHRRASLRRVALAVDRRWDLLGALQ